MAVSPGDQTAAANRFWTLFDQRTLGLVNSLLRRRLGSPRSRLMTLNVPIAGPIPPTTGWLTSVAVDTTVRVIGWQMLALTPGQIVVDVRISTIPTSPAFPPVLTSMPGSAHFPSLNGYGVVSRNTSGWARTEVQAGNILHFYVISASNIAQAVFGLQLMDLDARMLQT